MNTTQNPAQIKASRTLRLALAAAGMSLALTLGAGSALAQGGFTGPGAPAGYNGGFTGPGPALTTVEQANSLSDDSQVFMEGRIVQRVSDKLYVFQDATGTITVDINRKRWQGLTVSPEDVVQIWGEVDREWSGREIDVKRITKK